MTKTEKNNIYLWPDEHAWDKKKRNLIIEAFRPLSISEDKKAIIGAGADGMLPELNVLIEFAKDNYEIFLAKGFLTGMGVSSWKVFINGIKQVAKNIKPKPQNLELYQMGPKVTKSELLLWIKTGDKEILVTLVLDIPEGIDKALNTLPNAIDKAVEKKKNFGRLYWLDGKWHAI